MLKYTLAIIIFMHGLIHFMGFAKAFGYGNITQLTKDISKPAGVFWLLSAFLFITTTVLLLLKKESWPFLAIVAIIISQVLIVLAWKDAKFGTIANMIILFLSVTALFYDLGFLK